MPNIHSIFCTFKNSFITIKNWYVVVIQCNIICKNNKDFFI
jgi:hypothetical protein